MSALLRTLCLLLLSQTLLAQELRFSPKQTYTYFYPLDSGRLAFIMKHGLKDTTYLFTQKVDSIPSNTNIPQLKPGYYLLAQMAGRGVTLSVRQFPKYTYSFVAYNQQLEVRVQDSAFRDPANLKFYANGKLTPKDPHCQCYLLPQSKKEYLVYVTDGKYFEYSNFNFSPNLNEVYPRKYPDYQSTPTYSYGYALCNQPIYKPKDSVKTKAYLLWDENEPVKGKVGIYLYSNYFRNRILLAQLNPVSAGAYVYDFKLPDTLKIDQTYSLQYIDREGTLLRSSSFKLEDYKLRSNTYDAFLTKNKYYQGEPVQIQVRALDVNGLPLPNAQVKATFSIRHLRNFTGTKTFIPEEWYQNMYEVQIPIESNGPTIITLPDTILKEFDATLHAEVLLSDISGETKVFQYDFETVQEQVYYTLKVADDGLIHASCINQGKPAAVKVKLRQKIGNMVLDSQTLQLPAKLPMKQFAVYAELLDSNNKLIKDINLRGKQEFVSFEGIRKPGLIDIGLVNPSQLMLHIQLFRGKEKVIDCYADSFSYHKVDTSKYSYHLIYSLQVHDNFEVKERVFEFLDKTIEITHNLPAEIYPGQTVAVDLDLKLPNRKPAADVNLTAYAINAQFGGNYAPQLPNFNSEVPPLLRVQRTNFTRWPNSYIHQYFGAMSYHTLLKARLITMGDYRLMYPNEEWVIVKDSTYQTSPEVMPFVVGNGARIPVYAIKVDGHYQAMRNLYQTADFPILLTEGIHQISLRTQTAWYHLPKFRFDPKQRYVMSFDTLCLPAGITKVPTKDKIKFSEEEIATIKTYFMFLQPGQLVNDLGRIKFKQGVNEINANQQYLQASNERGEMSKWAYGPFKPYDSIEVYKDGQWVQTLWFNPKKHYAYYQNKIVYQEAIELNIDFNNFYFQSRHTDFSAKFNTYDKAPPIFYPNEYVEETQTTEDKKFAQRCQLSQHYVPDGVPLLYSLHLVGEHAAQLSYSFFYNQTYPKRSLSLPTIYHTDMGKKLHFAAGSHTVYLIDWQKQLMVLNLEAKEQAGAWYIKADTALFKEPCELLLPLEALTRKLLEAQNEFENNQITYRVEDYVSKIKLPKYEVNKTEHSSEVWGFVTKNEGNALQDVVITLEQNGVIKGISFADVSGGFLFKDMEPGLYELRFTRYGSCVTILQNLRVSRQTSMQLKVDLKLCGFSFENGQMVPSIFLARKKINEEQELKDAQQNLFSEKVYEKPIPGTGGVKGKVIDRKQQSALDIVNITLVDKKGKKYQTLTNESGEFMIRNLAPGKYRLIAVNVGYRNVVLEDIEVFASEDRLVSFGMENSTQQLQEVMVISSMDAPERDVVKLTPTSRSVERLSGQTLGVESRTGGSPSFRGARTDGTAYYIDGVRTYSASSNISVSGVKGLYVPITNQKSRMYEMVSNQDVKQERTDFKDYGYWIPNLVSNKQGKAHFSVTFPDNITRWQNYIVAMNARLDNTVKVFDTRSFKPIMAQLYLPRFAIVGDLMLAEGGISNYSGDSIQLQMRFSLNDSIRQSKDAFIGAGYRFRHAYLIGNNPSQTLGFTFKTDFGYQDGEKRNLEVFPNGIMLTQAHKGILSGDTTWQFKTDSTGEFTLSISNTFSQLLREEIEKLQNYAYGCVEQTASKLSALLIEKRLCQLMGDTFTKDKLVKICLHRLEDQQQKNGGWGWFRNASGEVWISHYVMKTLYKAKQLGYPSDAINKGLEFFQKNLSTLGMRDRILAMEVLFTYNIEFNLERYLRSIDESSLEASDRLRLNLLRQQMGEPSFAGYLFTDLKMNKDSSIWWNYSSGNLYQTSFGNTLLAYELLRGSETPEWIIKGVRQYFLREKLFGNIYGLNTLDAARLLELLAIEMATEEKGSLHTKFWLNQIPLDKKTPAKYTLTPSTSYQLTMQGAKAFVQVNRKYWDEKPLPDTNKFVVKTSFIQERKEVLQLKQQVPVTYQVNIHSKQNMEFVLLKIPIPASCEYIDKPNISGAVEVSYHKNEVWVYYRVLPKGTRSISLQLEPRFGGSYTLLPVQLEQMYEPELRGNNEVKRVEVK
jgi:hypothetical protein